MDEIKMYVFTPPGHGPFTFMVAERSLEEARKAVELKIASDPMTHGLSSEGFAEGDYTVHEFNVGEAEWNPND